MLTFHLLTCESDQPVLSLQAASADDARALCMAQVDSLLDGRIWWIEQAPATE